MDGQGIGMRSIGPDLIGVTRQRDPAWLSRWIREPDRMLAEKDPIALELFERFDKIPMPNLRLDENAAQSIMGFFAGRNRSSATAAGRAVAIAAKYYHWRRQSRSMPPTLIRNTAEKA